MNQLEQNEKMVVLDDGSGIIGKFNTDTQQFSQFIYIEEQNKFDFADPIELTIDYIDLEGAAAQGLLQLANQGGGRRKRRRKSRKKRTKKKSRKKKRRTLKKKRKRRRKTRR